MSNLIDNSEPRDFFVWIDLNDIMVKNNYEIGSFFSMPESSDNDNLMFLPNPKHCGFISPFQGNLLRNYLAEYNLEISRRKYFKSYPSRLSALFLFENESGAHKYMRANPAHVSNRVLKKVKSEANFIRSKHDSCWIDFLRLPHSMDDDTIHNVCNSYWCGKIAVDAGLISLGKPWIREPLFEILYKGHVSFDKSY